MEPSMFDMYKPKKKRKMPDGYTPPNLFSHEKKLKEQTTSLDELREAVTRLTSVVEAQERYIRRLQNDVTRLERQR